MGKLDPVTLSVLASALAGIAEEMGAVLIRGSYSSNIKERRDCSTALFDAEGRMVAQAEHIPVHLGAMPEAVAAIMGRDPEPGDVFAINDPYSGGTHLPDITLVSPVAPNGEILGYAVTRAHHSDVGGMRPGSVPSDSREIYQEGIIIPPVRLVRGGEYVDDAMSIDFTGTAEAVQGNVNCPLAVTRSACYFTLRILLPEDVPANAGTYAPLDIRAPEGSLVNAQSPSAVVAGNVETSSRIADVAMAALSEAADLPAQGQGTMNNTIIGGPGWTYYETIGGGQGASSKGPGPSGVHVGMSNTLNTPIEAFELEYPMRVERYELLYESGGAGEHRGGDGIVGAVRVLEPASLSLLTDRRRHQPRGANGGEPGAVGENLLNDEKLPAKVGRELEEGDVVTVKTPGGGGYGQP